MQEVIDLLRACQSRIDALTAYLPQYADLLVGFQVDANLEKMLLGLPITPDPPYLPNIYTKSPEQFLFTLPLGCCWDKEGRKLFHASGKEISTDLLYNISTAWVMIAIRNCYSSNLPPHFFFEFDKWYAPGRVSSIPDCIIEARLCESLEWNSDSVSEWFKSVGEACQLKDSAVSNLLLPFQRLLTTVRDFTPNPEAALTFALTSLHSVPLVVEKLSERSCLTSDWYFPRPAEQKALKSFFSEGLHLKAGLNGEFYEKTILAIAIWMGKDVENILNLKCIGYLEEIPFDEDS